MTNATISDHSTVTLHYRMTLEDGTEVDSTFDGEPLQFVMGDGTLIPGIEQLLCGLAAGAHEHLLLAPEQGFGYADPDNVHPVARGQFPADLVPEVGQVIAFDLPNGETLAGTVADVDDDVVQVDFNHPLAGRSVQVEVEVVAINNDEDSR